MLIHGNLVFNYFLYGHSCPQDKALPIPNTPHTHKKCASLIVITFAINNIGRIRKKQILLRGLRTVVELKATFFAILRY